MAWGFLFLGFMFITVAWRNKEKDLWALLKSDFTGNNNFFYWALAIIILVSIGSFRPLRPVSNAFLGLVLLVIVIAPYRQGRDLFSEIRSQIQEGTS
jgi:hypothetical protein